MDVYYFSRGVTQEFLDNARDKENPEGPVRFTTALVGPWDFLAVLDVEDGDFEAVKDLLSDLNQAGGDTGARPSDSTTAIAVAHGRYVIKRRRIMAFAAFVLIRVQRTPVREIFAELDHLDGYEGSAIVDGGFDILVELGAERYGDLRERLAATRALIEGRGRAEVCYQVRRREY
ncbi:MAG: hypothetical protein M3214_05040 [Actinomycetota bacterium]|nr:hypothetical protein [Actinomycetota bacterium]